jgi:hypothetical protein
MLDDFRQFSFPGPFRIGPPEIPEQMQEALERLAQGKDLGAGPAESVKLLVSLATELFRLRQKMVKPGTSEPREEVRRAWRHAETMGELFQQAGYEVQDHTGKRFEIGLDLSVVAYQPTAGIDRETIIETIRPSIYHQGVQIQRGEVVVGKPEAPGGSPATGAAGQGGGAPAPGNPESRT